MRVLLQKELGDAKTSRLEVERDSNVSFFVGSTQYLKHFLQFAIDSLRGFKRIGTVAYVPFVVQYRLSNTELFW